MISLMLLFSFFENRRIVLLFDLYTAFFLLSHGFVSLLDFTVHHWIWLVLLGCAEIATYSTTVMILLLHTSFSLK